MTKTSVVMLLLAVAIVTQGCGIVLNTVRSNGAPGALNTNGDSRIISGT